MNIVLFGPPGAGKGTHGDRLVKDLGLIKISTGDLLREEINRKTSLGEKITSIIDSGSLVSDNIINSLIEKMISNESYTNRLIFDGYPRNINQSKNLEILLKKYNQRIFCVLSLKVGKKEIVKRILGRQVCSKCGLIFSKISNPPKKEDYGCFLKHLKTRSDDNEKTILNRFETYVKETIPILSYYQNQKLLYEIDGMKKIDEIYKEIREIIRSLET